MEWDGIRPFVMGKSLYASEPGEGGGAISNPDYGGNRKTVKFHLSSQQKEKCGEG